MEGTCSVRQNLVHALNVILQRELSGASFTRPLSAVTYMHAVVSTHVRHYRRSLYTHCLVIDCVVAVFLRRQRLSLLCTRGLGQR